MNFGKCPYEDCDGEFDFMEVPDKSPQWIPIKCPKCQRKVWYKFSRIDPQAWTECEFLKNFTINEETKTIKAK